MLRRSFRCNTPPRTNGTFGNPDTHRQCLLARHQLPMQPCARPETWRRCLHPPPADLLVLLVLLLAGVLAPGGGEVHHTFGLLAKVLLVRRMHKLSRGWSAACCFCGCGLKKCETYIHVKSTRSHKPVINCNLTWTVNRRLECRVGIWVNKYWHRSIKKNTNINQNTFDIIFKILESLLSFY